MSAHCTYGEIKVTGKFADRSEVLGRILSAVGMDLSAAANGVPIRIDLDSSFSCFVSNGNDALLFYSSIREKAHIKEWNKSLERFFREVVEPITDSSIGVSTRLINVPEKQVSPHPTIICVRNKTIKDGAKSLLERMGLQIVGEAETVTDGLELIVNKKPNIVFFEVDSGLDSLKFCRVVRRQLPQSMLIMYSDKTNASKYFCRFRDAGVNAIILKSTPWKYWWYMLSSASAGHFWIDPHLNFFLNRDSSLSPERKGLTEFDIQLLIRLNFLAEDICEELHLSLERCTELMEELFKKLNVSRKPEALTVAKELGFELLPVSSSALENEELFAEQFAQSLDKWW